MLAGKRDPSSALEGLTADERYWFRLLAALGRGKPMEGCGHAYNRVSGARIGFCEGAGSRGEDPA
jgi:hypothetical protein